jgi:tetratricopeptide (TPR) repeat protein
MPGRGYRFVASTQTAPLQNAIGGPLRPPTQNAHAFQLYVAGWYALTRPGGRTLEKGLRDLGSATRIDPGFALAFAALGGAYSLSGVFGAAAPHEVFPLAREAVLRALRLDPDLPSAHSELGHIHWVYDLDFPAADREFRHALSLDPAHAHALHIWGLERLSLGDFDAALTLFHQAQAAEPLAVNISANIGMAHYYAGRYHEAIAQLHRALELDPLYAHTHGLLGRCYRQLGEYDRALEQFANYQGVSISGVSDVPTTLALAGRHKEARAELERVKSARIERHVPSFDIAEIHAALNDVELAIDWLGIAYEERVQPINFMMVEPLLKPLKGEQRFRALAKQVGTLGPFL